MTHWMEGDHPGEDPVFVDVRKLIEVARKVANGETSDNDLGALEDAIEAVESHIEDSDPRSMGWVGSDGLP